MQEDQMRETTKGGLKKEVFESAGPPKRLVKGSY